MLTITDKFDLIEIMNDKYMQVCQDKKNEQNIYFRYSYTFALRDIARQQYQCDYSFQVVELNYDKNN